MRHIDRIVRGGLILLTFFLVSCQGYTETMATTSSSQTMSGGQLTTHIGKANGTSTRDLETGAGSVLILDATVTLAVGKGTYKIELLADDDQVTLSIEASNGETVTGQGWMVTDAFGDAQYRVTAAEAENVDYQIEYAFR